jgi:hypothetical protein
MWSSFPIVIKSFECYSLSVSREALEWQHGTYHRPSEERCGRQCHTRQRCVGEDHASPIKSAPGAHIVSLVFDKHRDRPRCGKFDQQQILVRLGYWRRWLVKPLFTVQISDFLCYDL